MSEIKNCPFCGEEINVSATKCKHCGEWLNNNKNELQFKDVQSNENILKEDDILANIKFYSNWILVLITVLLSFYLAQIYWFISPIKKEQNSKIRLYNIFYMLTKTESPIINPTSIWVLFAFCFIFAIWYTMDLFMNNMISPVPLIGLWICFIFTGILEIKYAKIIEDYVFDTYNIKIKCNKFMTFVFQSFYLNYFLRRYKSKIMTTVKNKDLL